MENIRNFVIIAHIDHGKSTLADRFLEFTHSVESRKMKEQYLDTMELERERGITIKMQPVTMNYQLQAVNYKLNLIDTPGHVDFSYEVSRALAAVEGAILLVDATSGIQAQTVAHLHTALSLGLTVIPAINKIDVPAARPDEAEAEIIDLLASLNYTSQEIYRVSAKTGEGVARLLEAVVREVPPPAISNGADKLRALIFDSNYDDFRGVISHIRIMNGELAKNNQVFFMASGQRGEAKEVGIFRPQLVAQDKLSTGEIGYIVSGVKDIEHAPIGDTITRHDAHLRADKSITGYREPQPLVFSTIFPEDQSTYDDFKDALSKLKLNDAALYFEPDYSPALGRGMKVGFLGMLHMEIVLERLRREYDIELVVTAPSVSYKVQLKNGTEKVVFSPAQYPDVSTIEEVQEPWVNMQILVPPTYMNNVMNLLKTIRGEFGDMEYLGEARVRINYEAPLADVISDFYDNLKNVTSGFGSMAYEPADYRAAKIVKLDILLAEEEVEALSRLVPAERADAEGRRITKKLKDLLPSEQFAVAIQAAVGGKIIARETKSPMRKNVTGHLYGGDITRKRKLLEKQKKGKKRLREHGRVNLDPNILMKLFR